MVVYRYKHGWIPLNHTMGAADVKGDYESRVQLSRREDQVMRDYTGDSYQQINEYLRFGITYGDPPTDDIAALDGLIDRYELPGHTTAFRGLHEGDGFIPEGDAVGKVITSAGYSSTSLERPSDGFSDRKILMEIAIPKGTKGISVEGAGWALTDEREFILPHNTQFRVDADERVDVGTPFEQRRLKVSVIPALNPGPAPAASSYDAPDPFAGIPDYDDARDDR